MTPFRPSLRRGMTLVETMIASVIGLLVATTVMTTFIWTGKQSSLCSKIAWSQREAMYTNNKIEGFLRNARQIAAIDVGQGNWVDIKLADNSTNRFLYTNSVASLRDGRLLLLHTNGTETLVARGLTKITNTNGYPLPLFTLVNEKTLRVAYRVAQPATTGAQATDDSLYAAVSRFAVCLRNAP